MPVISDIENKWFSDQLRAANEPALAPDVRQTTPYRDVIRFTWLRSFHAPVFVRIEGLRSDSVRIIAKELSGTGGYKPGSISKRVDKPLSAGQAEAFRRIIAQTNVLNLPAKRLFGNGSGMRLDDRASV
jgi:hypothetical protein